MIRDTSMMAWRDLTTTQKLGDRQQSVLNALQSVDNPITAKQVAKLLGWEINRVSGRITELLKLGAIEDAGVVFNESTRRPEHVWRPVGKINKQLELF